MLEIDLRATFIPDTKKVWRLFPGSGYRFLEKFREEKLAFLDLPGLSLPEPPLRRNHDLLQRVLTSAAIGGQKRQDGPTAQPQISADEFENARMGPARGRLVQAVVNLYQEAAPGDVIVVPSPTYDSNIIVGQVTSAEIINTTYQSDYDDAKIPARLVNWIAEIDERKVSHELSSSLRNQHPFSLIEASLHNEIFSIAYHNFYRTDLFSALLLNENADFLDRDAALIGLISSAAALATYLREVKDSTAASSSDLISAILGDIPIEYSCSQSSDIHSPGFTRLTSAKATSITTAAVIAILVGLAYFSSKETVADDLNQVTIVNSLAPSDDICTPQVSEAAGMSLRSIGHDALWAACQKAKAMEERTGLNPGVKATQKPHRGGTP